MKCPEAITEVNGTLVAWEPPGGAATKKDSFTPGKWCLPLKEAELIWILPQDNLSSGEYKLRFCDCIGFSLLYLGPTIITQFNGIHS